MFFEIPKCRFSQHAVALLGFVGAVPLACSGNPSTSGGSDSGGTAAVSAGGTTSAGGNQSTVSTGVCASRPSSCYALCEGGLCNCYCPESGGAGSGTGGTKASGGNAQASGGSSSRGLCGSGCTLESTSSVFCTASQVAVVCWGPWESNLAEIMKRNGCTDAATNAVRYCCPPAITTQCQ